jgi:hypothetical protein
MITECILNEAQALGRWADLEVRLDHLLIVRVTWAQHHPVLAKGDRTPVAIGRDVPDGQCWHDASVPRRIMHDSRHSTPTDGRESGHVGSLFPVRRIGW